MAVQSRQSSSSDASSSPLARHSPVDPTDFADGFGGGPAGGCGPQCDPEELADDAVLFEAVAGRAFVGGAADVLFSCGGHEGCVSLAADCFGFCECC